MASEIHQHSDTGEVEKFVSHASDSFENLEPLPERYGDDRLVSLARDPRCLFVYWEFTTENSDRMRREGGNDIWEQSDFILRLYDDFGAFFDVSVPKESTRWYVHLPRDGGGYVVDLGLRRRDAVFFSLLRSNRVQLPAGRISNEVDTQFASVSVSQSTLTHDSLNSVSQQSLDQIGQGSAAFSKSMAQRWEFLKSVFSGSPWGPVSSHSLPSSSQSGRPVGGRENHP